MNLQHLLIVSIMALGACLLSLPPFIEAGATNSHTGNSSRPGNYRVVVHPNSGPNQVLLNHRATEEFTLQDLNYLQRYLSDAQYVSPAYFEHAVVTARNARRHIPIEGIDRVMESESIYQPIAGTGFSDAARRGLILECMLTQSAAKALKIDLKRQPYLLLKTSRLRVTGIIADPPQYHARLQNGMVLPLIIAQMLWGGPDQIDHIVVACDDADQMAAIILRLQHALDSCRAPGAYELSYVKNVGADQTDAILAAKLLFYFQGGICLLMAMAAIIYVMSTRRRREYAIRVAMGAKTRVLMAMVMLESTLFGLFGGVLGILIAIMVAVPTCGWIFETVFEHWNLPSNIRANGILIPLLFCIAGGFFAGILPAIRTRKMNILNLLRSE